MVEEANLTPDSQKISKGGEDNSSDNNAGKSRATNKKDPHYLRASTGSCHDSCKYGKPHEFKNKPWKPMRKRVSAPHPNSEKPMEIKIFVDRQVKVTLVADKVQSSFTQDAPLPLDGIKKNIPSSRKSPEPNSSRLVKQGPRLFTKSPSPEVSKVMKKVVQSCGKSPLSVALKPIKQEVASTPRKDVSMKRAFSNAKERSASVGPAKSNGPTMKPSSSAGSSIVLGGKRTSKTTTVNDPRTSPTSIKKDMTPPAAMLSSKKTSKFEVKRTLNSSVPGSSRATPEDKARSSNLRNNKSPIDLSQRRRVSSKNQRITNKTESDEHIKEKVEEKTLYMIETREDHLSDAHNGSLFIESPSPLSPESLNSSSQANSHSFTSHEVNDEQDVGSEYADRESDGSITDSSKDEKGPVGHGEAVDSRDQDPTVMKLKFKRGKIINPQPKIVSPQRMRFRQGTSAGDNQSGGGGPMRRSYRRRSTNGDKKEPVSAPVKVVLKHQEIEMKKDMQVLFNNVIQETASKLVETRKSKVKALVGAFETVISLQESKPSSPATAAAANDR